MKWAFLIKYVEIALKGKNRYQFINALVNQVKLALKDKGNFQVKKEQGRIFVDPMDESYDYHEVIKGLEKVFGIVSICPVVVLESANMEDIKTHILKYI